MSGDHKEREHALLSASGAERWIACPPSPRLTEHIPDKSSVYADEGTLAHEISEIKIRRRLEVCNSKRRAELDNQLTDKKLHHLYAEEMDGYTDDYVQYVEEQVLEAKVKTKDAAYELEARLDYSAWVPEGKGTGDFVIVSDDVLEIIDLKYGKGKPVSAKDNPQIRLYALGALSAYDYLYDIRSVRMTIVQPRLDSISSETLSVEALKEWAESVVAPAAKLAWAGEGEITPGKHCQFCKAKATCRARADKHLELVAYEFKDPRLLTLEEIGQMLPIIDTLKMWAEHVDSYALEAAKNGQTIPGFKLVAGTSRRSITDADAATAAFKAAEIADEKVLKPRELQGISNLEKNVGKKKVGEIIGHLIVKPDGAPTLVPETDPRPALGGAAADFADDDFDYNQQ